MVQDIHLSSDSRIEPLLLDTDFLKALFASSDGCFTTLDLDGNLTFMSEHGKRLFEVSDFSQIYGASWPSFWEGETANTAWRAIEEARTAGTAEFQGLAKTAAGSLRFWRVRVTAICGSNNLPKALLCVSHDITASHEAELRNRLLMDELDHRIQNILAVVRAISLQTLRRSSTLAEARKALASRLSALGVATRALLKGDWQSVPLKDLVKHETGLYAVADTNRFSIEGPDVMLTPRAVLPLCLVLHELGTNALKYGALSLPTGQVRVQWSLVDKGHVPHLQFQWLEEGGPAVQQPTRTGYGSHLIKRSLADIGATIEARFPPSGLTMHFEAPMSAVQASAPKEHCRKSG